MELDTKNIKLIILNFDGVLTDNFLYINDFCEETVRCCGSDSIAINILRSKGIKFLVLTNEAKNYITFRCKRIGVFYKQVEGNKVDSLDSILKKFDVKKEEILFIGNDLNDVELMKSGILSCCPYDSDEEILKISNIRLKTRGGFGIIRELLSIMENK